MLYVDDLLILGNDLQRIKEIKVTLSAKFRMKDMGNNDLTYLGMSITKQQNCILIDQSKYLQSILTRFGMKDVKVRRHQWK